MELIIDSIVIKRIGNHVLQLSAFNNIKTLCYVNGILANKLGNESLIDNGKALEQAMVQNGYCLLLTKPDGSGT